MISSFHFPTWLYGAEWFHHGIYISITYGISLIFIIILTMTTQKRLRAISQKLTEIDPLSLPNSKRK